MLVTTIRRLSAATGVAVAAALALLATQRHTPGALLPHGYCFTWNPALLWTHVTSDSLIGLAYISIPLTLLHLVRKRADMPFNWIVTLFATFIVSCGATHWIEVWTVWNPDYWLSGSVKAITAAASVMTAVSLVYLVPRILAIPSSAQMDATLAALEREVARRRLVEEELRAERAELERRVEARTAELAVASAAAQAARAVADDANRQKDRFLAKVSHELRTPLQSTLTWAQALSLSVDDPQRARLAAARIIHNVRVQARLIDDLLDISRALSGKLQLAWQRADAVQAVQRAVDVVRDAARAQDVMIDWTSDSPGTPVATDPARLEQVAWNLVSNAVHASAPHGRVRVAMHQSADGTLRLVVEDQGRGIAAADLPHIFEPFLQAGVEGNRHQGLGLGLAIVHNIVTLFGGEIVAASDGPGHGARFSVTLPPAPERESQDAPPTPAAALADTEMQRLQGLRVLYVEDEPELGEGVRQVLTALGVVVRWCRTFDDARQRIAESVPHGAVDVLLSDLALDGDHIGLALLPLLRATPGGASIPALIISAHGSEADRRRSMAAGFAAHLVKPVDGAEMARALLAALHP